jgi:hypothetical protein
MPANHESLLAGRNAQPLDAHMIRSATTAFMGLDALAPVKYEPEVRTQFRVRIQGDAEIAEIVFGPDIYPGQGIDANSTLSVLAVAAHELIHLQRWRDHREITNPALIEIDEALTSLEAIHRFAEELSPHECRLLVADAMQRLQMYAQRQPAP